MDEANNWSFMNKSITHGSNGCVMSCGQETRGGGGEEDAEQDHPPHHTLDRRQGVFPIGLKQLRSLKNNFRRPFLTRAITP